MKKLTNAKAFWLTTLFSLLFFMITCWSMVFQDTTPYWIQSIGYFMLTYICLDEFSKKLPDLNAWMIGFASLLGLMIIEAPVRIYDFPSTYGSLMIGVSCVVAILLAVICFKDKRSYSFILAFIILVLFNSVVADMWHNYMTELRNIRA